MESTERLVVCHPLLRNHSRLVAHHSPNITNSEIDVLRSHSHRCRKWVINCLSRRDSVTFDAGLLQCGAIVFTVVLHQLGQLCVSLCDIMFVHCFLIHRIRIGSVWKCWRRLFCRVQSDHIRVLLIDKR
ncbi:hypothetical protein BLNAU_16444 [Blattamonas nauphoetae]|uniref:Uncharacterized protein n=1 Tax=Blattamonas nauphoetae TaxID=2049346 RepID=A0ABQ9XEH4_9EUKA|nr:hypothetical protein BLNAU_16444 [Blattamonas nauphoetae]